MGQTPEQFKTYEQFVAAAEKAGIPHAPYTEARRLHVYEAINKVTEDLARVGLGKDSKNESQGYKFRGIDAVYNVLASLLAKHKLVILPRMTERTVTERQNKNGGVLFSVCLSADFDFVSAVDGSKHTVVTYGEAMDSGDKATNKAMSAAMKYACLMTFTIPTEGDNDADATTHEVKAPMPAGYQEWLTNLEAAADEGLSALEAAYKAKAPDGCKAYLVAHGGGTEPLKARARKADDTRGAK